MSLPFQPIAGRHAIETCSVAVRFAQAVDAEAFEAIRHVASFIAASNDLPRAQAVVAPQLVFNVVGGVTTAPTGAAFQRYAPDGVVEAELRCDGQAIFYQLRKYEGWAALREFLDNALSILLPLYLSSASAITHVNLQYDDVFVRSSDAPTARASEVFKPDNNWIVAASANAPEQWHSHFGTFVPQNEQHRKLLNVNVTVSDQFNAAGIAERRIGLVMLVSEGFDIPGRSPLVLAPDHAAPVVLELLDSAHDKHKEMLSELLTDEYLEAIGIAS